MAYSPEIQPVYDQKIARARRLFHPEPDHATKGAPFRSTEQKLMEMELSRRRERVGEKAAESYIEETLSGPIDPTPLERKTLWAIATPNSLTIKVVYQPQV